MLSIIFLKIITFITWSKILINILLSQITLDKILAISRWQFNQTTHGESDQVAIKNAMSYFVKNTARVHSRAQLCERWRSCLVELLLRRRSRVSQKERKKEKQFASGQVH
jgi:hypothetical protein